MGICRVDLIRVLRLRQFVIGILSTPCMECYNLHGVHNLHGMYSFEQHSIAIDSHENVMEQLSTTFCSVTELMQSFADVARTCKQKSHPSQSAQQPCLAYKSGLAQM